MSLGGSVTSPSIPSSCSDSMNGSGMGVAPDGPWPAAMTAAVAPTPLPSGVIGNVGNGFPSAKSPPGGTANPLPPRRNPKRRPNKLPRWHYPFRTGVYLPALPWDTRTPCIPAGGPYCATTVSRSCTAPGAVLR